MGIIHMIYVARLSKARDFSFPSSLGDTILCRRGTIHKSAPSLSTRRDVLTLSRTCGSKMINCLRNWATEASSGVNSR